VLTEQEGANRTGQDGHSFLPWLLEEEEVSKTVLAAMAAASSAVGLVIAVIPSHFLL
jgi:hypothetical protein